MAKNQSDSCNFLCLMVIRITQITNSIVVVPSGNQKPELRRIEETRVVKINYADIVLARQEYFLSYILIIKSGVQLVPDEMTLTLH